MARRLTVARALFIASVALFGFLTVGTMAKIVQPGSWTCQTLLIAAFMLIASGGFVSFRGKRMR